MHEFGIGAVVRVGCFSFYENNPLRFRCVRGLWALPFRTIDIIYKE